MLLTLRARAKINLYLHVVGKRADGYHLLDSLVVFADLGDELRIAPSDKLSLAIDGPFGAGLSATDDNLVLRAARALAAALAGKNLPAGGAALRLTKRLPVASGIGGGSADAAAALVGLARLWRVSEGAVDLAQIGLGLGADLPVCLAARPSFMSGIGELLDPAPPLPDVQMLLVNPRVGVSTPAVFKARRGDFSTPARWRDGIGDAASLAVRLARCGNDLEAPAIAIEPVVGEVLAALRHLPGNLLARMSGSGATCFGLFAKPAEVREAAARLGVEHPSWWIASTPMLNRQAAFDHDAPDA